MINKKTIFGIALVVVVVVLIFLFNSKKDVVVIEEEKSTEISSVTIMVPENLSTYDTEMNKFIFDGGSNPLESLSFVKKVVSVATTTDVIKASAGASASYIKTQGGEMASKIEYFKIVDGTAYVVLGMQLNGWAGVSISFEKIKPLVEKTLLQFPEIKNVKFETAPGDSIEDLINNL
ncbi:MAG: hypothetical protein QG585_107 [Patescibacteria group bacterium]|nr:hypothetical protein [Patescibacteria group bacterium]